MAVQLLETWHVERTGKNTEELPRTESKSFEGTRYSFYRRLYRRILSPSRVAVDGSIYGEPGD